MEYTKEGFQTTFAITVKEPCRRYEFEMENSNFTGHWVGIFSETENGGTKIEFTEELNFKNPVMGLISHLFLNLKKIQETYIRDLRSELGEA